MSNEKSELIEALDSANARVAALEAALVEAEALRAAKGDPLLASAVEGRLRVSFDDGHLQLRVVDGTGRARTVTRNGRFSAMGVDDLVREVRDAFKEVFTEPPKEGVVGDKDAKEPASPPSLTALMASEAERRRTATSSLSDAERERLRRHNPFRRGETFNLTRQMALMSTSPAFADELRRAANMAA